MKKPSEDALIALGEHVLAALHSPAEDARHVRVRGLVLDLIAACQEAPEGMRASHTIIEGYTLFVVHKPDGTVTIEIKPGAPPDLSSVS